MKQAIETNGNNRRLNWKSNAKAIGNLFLRLRHTPGIQSGAERLFGKNSLLETERANGLA